MTMNTNEHKCCHTNRQIGWMKMKVHTLVFENYSTYNFHPVGSTPFTYPVENCFRLFCLTKIKKNVSSTAAGFEPARACPRGMYTQVEMTWALLVIPRLNHSAKQPSICVFFSAVINIIYLSIYIFVISVLLDMENSYIYSKPSFMWKFYDLLYLLWSFNKY